MIDSHCHLEYMDDTVIEEARGKMTAVFTSSPDPEHYGKTLLMAKNSGHFVFACLGFHPEVMHKYTDHEIDGWLDFIRKNRHDISAIGEVGLDYNWTTAKTDQERSKYIFVKFIRLAEELGLPLVIHGRNGRDANQVMDAIGEAMSILAEESAKRVMFHCFSGSESNLRFALSRGWLISYATIICKSEKHQRLARETPLEQMLLDTDSPWLDPDSPELINRPWKIERSAEIIADKKGTTKEEVLRITEENAKKFFQIKA